MGGFHLRELTWRARATYLAHAFKAVTRQHHQEITPVLQRWVTPEAVVFDVGGHAGQFAKLFAKMARRGQVYSFEPGGYVPEIDRRPAGPAEAALRPRGRLVINLDCCLLSPRRQSINTGANVVWMVQQ